MPKPDAGEFLEYVKKIGEAARNGTMEWSRANPTTLVHTQVGPQRARIVIQRVDRPVREQSPLGGVRQRVIKQYVFQVTQGPANIQMLSMDGSDDEHINQALETLYETVSQSISRKGLDFLKSLIPPDQPK